MKTIKKEQFIIFWVVVLVLAAVFFRLDLTISEKVFNRLSPFGRIFEVIGEYPNSIALIAGASWIFAATQKTRKLVSVQSLILFLVSGIGWGGLTLFSWKHFYVEDVDLSFKVLAICGLISLVGDIAMLYLFTKIDDRILQKYVKIALLAVLTALIQLAVINILKIIWGRMRFRDMTDATTQFSTWLVPQFFTGEKSFPSGHTANATTIITMLPIIKHMSNEKKPLKIGLTVLMFAWPITVAVSRVIVGAHFASDVLFGMAITVTVFYVLSNKILSKNELKN